MINTRRIRAATADDTAALTRVLSNAFQDDPGTIVFEPDPVRRRAILPPFFRTFIAASFAEGGDIVVRSMRAYSPARGTARAGASPRRARRER